MASSSYIQLINKIQAFCDAHLAIKRFDAEFGEQRPNLATDSELYPYVFMEPNSVDGGYDVRNFSVTLTCYDVIQKDRANINTIVSDCEQDLQDLFAYFNQGKDSDIIAISQTKTPLNNYDLDYVAGWSMSIVFELEGWCTNAIPMLPITPDSDADVTVENSDTTYQVSVDCGDTLVLPDDTYEIYVNGVLNQTVIQPSIKDTTLNITA